MFVKFVKSMRYALNGILTGIKEERNVRIDVVAAVYVLFFSGFYDFTITRKAVIVLVCFNVIAFELMNTAVERAVDKPDKEHYMQAGAAKDAAAGGVLIAAAGAAVAGIMFFWNTEVFRKIFTFFTGHPLMLICFAVSLFVSYKFITLDSKK